jgi:hypothetical protein
MAMAGLAKAKNQIQPNDSKWKKEINNMHLQETGPGADIKNGKPKHH